ncbi:homoserine O-acetyltransferase [Pontibacter ummariensis]|uniref:Homoserine O-acetyltransferase n=1 Tax=Pontibacter ummariensis TaxID=1610492 RepID=A0A239K0R8_9BACT|nr:homoserine O-acetyltransferase [Pontibacter ummariensis]PRY06802.1 homoserine O-acetyltransferase [Pontibacter ummariensis]SNT11273.1 homoserine O-acetyltransferase [Pontibacter ummariensis]
MPIQDVFHYQEEFVLESGATLPGFQLAYTTYGTLNPDRSNVVWVCHALTGSSDFTDWWSELFGEGKLYDPQEWFIICANALGGCYGSTGPLSKNPKTLAPYYHAFPQLTNRDIVAAFDKLRQELALERVHTLIGGSLGGQQALEWVLQQPKVFERLVHVVSNARHSPWGVAFNESQRMAIRLDPSWGTDTPEAGAEGLKTARAIAMLSYRHYNTYAATQQEPGNSITDNFRAASYQVYQGEKLAGRFNAYSYWLLSKAMDSHNIGRDRGGLKRALAHVKTRCLFVGVNTDILFPVEEQRFLHQQVPGSSFYLIHSSYGHDGFLVECEQLAEAISNFYQEETFQEELNYERQER